MKKQMRRLLILIIITCIVNIAFDVFLFYENYNTQENYEVIVNKYMPHEEGLLHLSEYLYETESMALAQIITNSGERSQECIKRIKELDRLIRTNLTSFSVFTEDEEQKKLLRELYDLYSGYYSQQKFVSELGTEDRLKMAQEYVNKVMETNINKMNSTLQKLKDRTQKQIDSGKEDLKNARAFSSVLLICVSAFFILLVVSSLILVRRSSFQLAKKIDKEIKKREKRIIYMQSKTIEGMAELVESRDGETGLHVRNTAFYTELLAKKLAENSPYKKVLTPDYIALLKRYAPLHDVGKIVVSDTILLKPARLTKDEFELMKAHTVEGGQIIDSILSDIETPEHVKIARDIAVYHHEKWDGTGYPHQLAGEDIPLCARIMSVADVFDALVSKRCYKKAFSLDEAYNIMKDASGTQFDPILIDAFFSERKVVEAYLKKLKKAM